MEEFLNKLFVIIFSACGLMIVHAFRYNFYAAILALVFGCANFLIGAGIQILFYGRDTLTDLFLLKLGPLESGFVISGYVGMIAAMYGAMVYILKQIAVREP